jgi:hypothetical protein
VSEDTGDSEETRVLRCTMAMIRSITHAMTAITPMTFQPLAATRPCRTHVVLSLPAIPSPSPGDLSAPQRAWRIAHRAQRATVTSSPGRAEVVTKSIYTLRLPRSCIYRWGPRGRADVLLGWSTYWAQSSARGGRDPPRAGAGAPVLRPRGGNACNARFDGCLRC